MTPASSDAWAWMQGLINPARWRPAEAVRRLEDAFRTGTTPAPAEGMTEAILTPTVGHVLDQTGRLVLRTLRPLRGKEFFPDRGRGHNVFDARARAALRVPWPTYRPAPHPLGLAGFEFETRVERGAHNPDLEVLVCDYTVILGNPRFLMRSARDEYREIAPGVLLGKGILRMPGGSWRLIGYEALRTWGGS